MCLEGFHRLVHQRHPVRHEQNALHPSSPHQHVDQRNHGAGLAGAGGHHQQALALLARLEGLLHTCNRPFLIITFDNLAVDCNARHRLAALAPLDQQLQLVLL